MFDNMFDGIMGKIKPGCCRLSMNGRVAVRTSDGTYKTYNPATGNLTNYSNHNNKPSIIVEDAVPSTTPANTSNEIGW